MMPTKTTPFYEQLKRESETKFGIVTNCFNVGKLKAGKVNPVYTSNCALKICSKLGGTCHALQEALPLHGKTTMIIGIDVYVGLCAPVWSIMDCFHGDLNNAMFDGLTQCAGITHRRTVRIRLSQRLWRRTTTSTASMPRRFAIKPAAWSTSWALKMPW
jgi:hypothetical protein